MRARTLSAYLIAYGSEDPPPQYRLRPRQFSTYQPHSEKGHYEDVLWVCAKRLEKGRFTWPQFGDVQGKVVLSHEELSLLLGGIDLAKTKHKQWYRKAPPEGHAAA
ncbi:MAG: IS66 family insertion sequence element accessory protein TnpB [Burkholderiales bacterium]